ncbi:MAG TPA: potassium-transporting ATPase subunit KdpC [Bacteroidia bacterium]|jgi:K+-transporting ATPase ATPase C chain|nr:potassium-transporting ATPase subunit KdpC [Bacteroidia bacterium]
MKKYLMVSLRLTVVLLVLLCVIYPLFIAAVAKLAPGGGDGVTVSYKGKVVGYENIGQGFKSDKYFQPRPSATSPAYNAAGSGASNKGPTNPDYLKSVQAAIDTFMVHNPGVNKADVPAELVTASGSGLDPDLSPAGAKIQIKRIAVLRHVSEQDLLKLVDEHTQQPLLGFLGPARVNVLKLNIALDEMQNKN